MVFLGGSSQFNATGLIRIDTTGLADPHAFYLAQNDPEGTVRRRSPELRCRAASAPSGAAGQPRGPRPISTARPSQSAPRRGTPVGPNTPFDPFYTPFINLIANPQNPFLTASTILVTNTAGFTNTGAKAKWTAYDQALKPETFNTTPNDPWATPTSGIHRIITMVDPVTHKTRLIFGDDNGIFTAVDDGTGNLIGSLGDVATLTTNQGDVQIATGSRNGNLQTTQFYYGAAEPSNLAAQVSLLKGMFYGSTAGDGSPYSDTNVINVGATGYGDLTWARPYVEPVQRARASRSCRPTRAIPASARSTATSSPRTMDNTAAHTMSPPASVVTDFLQPRPDQPHVQPAPEHRRPARPGPQRPDRRHPRRPVALREGLQLQPSTPSSGEQAADLARQNGTVFSTENQGKFWNVIGNPGALDSSNAQALAYGAPDVNNSSLGNLDSFIYAGTIKGEIFVTFNGGGTNGNQWTNLDSKDLDGSAIQEIITNPTRTSHEVYAITQKGVYHMADSKSANATWVNITGNLFQLTTELFNDPNQVQRPGSS